MPHRLYQIWGRCALPSLRYLRKTSGGRGASTPQTHCLLNNIVNRNKVKKTGRARVNSKKRFREDTGAVCTTNPARWRLGSRLRLGATAQLLQFGRSHPSHFYQLCCSPPYTPVSISIWLPALSLTGGHAGSYSRRTNSSHLINGRL